MHRVLLVLFLIAALVLAACGGSDEEAAAADEASSEVQTVSGRSTADGLPEVNPLEVKVT